MAEYKLSFTAKEIEDKLKLISSKQVLLEKRNFDFQSWESLGGLYAWEDPLVELVPGCEYLVEWDNIEYICKAFDVSSMAGHTAFGMGSMPTMGIAGNNEPFAIIYHAADTTPVTTLIASDGSTAETHTMIIYKQNEVVGVSSWNDLTDKPFYDNSISAECDLSLAPTTIIEFQFPEDEEPSICGKVTNIAPTKDQLLKTTLYLSINENKFTIPIIENNVLYSSDDCTLAMATNEDDTAGGVFLIFYRTGTVSFLETSVEVPEIGTYMIGYSDRIGNITVQFVCDDIKTLEAKYLPTTQYINPIIDLLPMKTLENFILNSNFGLYFAEEKDFSYHLTANEIYVVEWDGLTYQCVGQDTSAVFGEECVVIGNGSVAGLAGNNEPFIIASFTDGWKAYVPLENPNISHTARIYKLVENPGYKIKEECIPEFARKTIFEEQLVEFKDLFDLGTISTSKDYYTSHLLIEGESYVVRFDGVDYDAIAFYSEEGKCMVLGRWNDFNTTYPFVLTILEGVLTWGIYDTSTEHTCGLYQRVNLFNKASSVSSWEDLTNKPFGEVNEMIPLMEETQYDGFALDEDFSVYKYDVNSAEYTLVLGETYIVKWDGVPYSCVAQDMSALNPGTIALGNLSTFGGSGASEPFVIGWTKYGISYFSFDEETTHTVGIYQNRVTVKSLDTRFLEPFTYIEGEGVDLLPEQMLPFADMNDGTGMYNTVVQSAERLLIAGKTYVVIWDGVEYTFVCQTISIENETTEYIGNMMFVDGEDTGEPMGIAQFAVTMEDGTVVYIVSMVTPDTLESHSIALKTGGGRWVLNESALPMEAIEAKIEEMASGGSGGGSSLPQVNESDEGKILRVVNGVWTAVALPSAEEASF